MVDFVKMVEKTGEKFGESAWRSCAKVWGKVKKTKFYAKNLRRKYGITRGFEEFFDKISTLIRKENFPVLNYILDRISTVST